MSRVYNHKPQLLDNRDFIYQSHSNPTPTSHFLNDVKMLYCPILNQGNLGSCVAHASYALFYIISSGNMTLSRLQLYLVGRATEGSSLTKDTGLTIRGVMKAISKYGLCNESIWPYVISNFANLAPLTAFKNTYNLSKFKYTFIPQNLNSIKQVLSSGSPIIFGIVVYSSFESSNASKYGVIPMPNISKEKNLGGHAILLVGYDDKSQTFKFQNSWGTSWGNSGYGWIPYAYVVNSNLAFDFCSISLN
jgi:C1A family cysteine protease